MKNIDFSAEGLHTFVNEFSRPDGSLKDANNFDILRDGIYQTARGYKTQQRIPSERMFVFNGKNIAFSNGAFYYQDDSGQYVLYSNGFEADPNIYGESALNNFYFNTSNGVYKFDGSNNPILAGVPRGLSGSGVPSGSENIIPDGEHLAYRIVWGYRDEFNTLYLGAPSTLFLVNNTTGSPTGAEINFYVPNGVSENYFYQVYRTLPVANTIQPAEEYFLVEEVPVTSAEILAEEVVYEDKTEETSATLYTSISQQGIEGSNFEPPLCKDLTLYNDIMAYANFRTRDFVNLKITGTAQGNVFNFFNRNGDVTIGSNAILNVSSVSNLRVGQALTDNTIFPEGTVIDNIVLPDTVNVSQNALVTNVGQALVFRDAVTIGSDSYYAGSSDNYTNNIFQVFNGIEQFSNSLVNIINATSDEYSAYYNGIGEENKGSIFIQADTYSGTFLITSSQPNFTSPTLPFESQFDDFSNAVQLSKPNQPEACLIGAIYPIGSREFPISRVKALKDGIYIFKGDGVFKMTGTNPINMSIRRVDNNTILTGDRTLTTLDNSIIAFTEQGVSIIDQSGSNIISRQIESELIKLSSLSNFKDLAFGMSYEVDRKYYLFVPMSEDDTTCTKCFMFNYATNTWMPRLLSANDAVVNYNDNLMYIAGDKISQELKSYTEQDYVQDQFEINITLINGSVLTVSDAFEAKEGDTLTQGDVVAKILTVDNQTITLDSAYPYLTLGEAVVIQPMNCYMVLNPITGGDPSAQKHFQDLVATLEKCNSGSFKIGFETYNNCDFKMTTMTPKVSGAYGDCGFGEESFGESFQIEQNLRTITPLEYSRNAWIRLKIEHDALQTYLSLLGITLVASPVDTRTRK